MKGNKKILQITTTYQASPGRIMEDLQRMGEADGYEMIGAIGRGVGSSNYKFMEIGNALDVYKHVARTRLFDQHGFGSKKATIEFIKKVRKIDPDVIHLHNIHGYYINVEILFDYLKEVNKPVIWTLHDCWPFTGHCVHFEYEGCECWKPGGNHRCIQKENYPTSWLVNNSKDNYVRKKKSFTGLKNLTIVTPSEWLAKLVKKSFLNEYPVKVINNGIDIEIFKPTKSTFKEKNNISNRYIILGVANIWGKKKGYDFFMELSDKIKSNEIIVLVGLNEKEVKDLPSNILGITRTNSIEELAQIYSAADVFINPTLEDNFPTTNIEALASGTPVITFNTGGSPEIIDENTGIVIKSKTTKSIIKAIAANKDNPKVKTDCRDRGKIFSKEQMYNKYRELYLEEK